MSSKDDPITLEKATVLRGSSKAVLVRFEHEGESRTEWFPLSQVHDDSEVWNVGDEGVMLVTRWIASEKGLVELDD
jgi:hypothetical protein